MNDRKSMMWLDIPDKKVAFLERMKAAYHRFYERYGCSPAFLFTRETDETKDISEILGMQVVYFNGIPPNHVVLAALKEDFLGEPKLVSFFN